MPFMVVQGPVAIPSASTGTFSFAAGLDYPWIAYGADFGTGGYGTINNIPQVAIDFATFRAQGVNTVRWWILGDGRYCPTFNLDGTVLGLNSGFLSDLDTCLQIAADNGIYIIMSLIDFTMFNVALDGGSGVVLGGHDDIVKDSARRTLFMDNCLKPILQHVAAGPNQKQVLLWEVFNEVEDQIAGGYNGFSFFTGPAQFALRDVQDFVRIAASYIHTYGGPGALATTGSAIPVWVPLWIGLGLDVLQAHYYDFMDGGGASGSGLVPVANITTDTLVHLDAPVIVGEYPTASLTSYGLNDTAVKSARWYMDTIQSRGYAGNVAWSLNGGDVATDWASFNPVFTNWMNVNYPGKRFVPGFPPPLLASDVFGRGTGPLGSNWIDSSGFAGGTMSIVDDGAHATVVGTGAVWRLAYWNPSTVTFPDNQYSEVVISTAHFVGAVVRHQVGTSSGYVFLSNGNLYRLDSAAFTLLGSGSVPGAAGTNYRLTAVGSTLTGYANGTAVVTVVDATYSGGQPGIGVNNGIIAGFLADRI